MWCWTHQSETSGSGSAMLFCRLHPSQIWGGGGGGRGGGAKTAQMEELSESSPFWLKALLTQSAQISSRNKPQTHLCWLIPVQCWLKIEALESWNVARLSFVEWLDFCWLRNPQHLSSQNAQMHLFIHCFCLCRKYTTEEGHADLSCVTMSTTATRTSTRSLCSIFCSRPTFFYWFLSFCPS